MVPGERVEGAQLLPPGTQLLCSVVKETANVRSHERDPELVELEDPDYGSLEVVPLAPVVPEPVGGVVAGTDEGRPADNESPLGCGVPDGRLRGHGLPPAVHGVSVVVGPAKVLGVHTQGLPEEVIAVGGGGGNSISFSFPFSLKTMASAVSRKEEEEGLMWHVDARGGGLSCKKAIDGRKPEPEEAFVRPVRATEKGKRFVEAEQQRQDSVKSRWMDDAF